MKKIVVSVQNSLLAEVIVNELKATRAFDVFKPVVGNLASVVTDCEVIMPQILLMDVDKSPLANLEQRLKTCAEVRKRFLNCKMVLICDENAMPDVATAVMKAKQNKLIDEFFHTSVTSSYLVAALQAL